MKYAELQPAWDSYKKNVASSRAIISQGDSMLKDAIGIPVSGKVNIWFAGSAAVVEAMAKRLEGYQLRVDADECWRNAILKSYGDVRVLWFVTNEVLKCTLDSGEVFE